MSVAINDLIGVGSDMGAVEFVAEALKSTYEPVIVSTVIVPASTMLCCSIVLFVSFALLIRMSWGRRSVSLLSLIEHLILAMYSFVTRRIHLPKRDMPKQFTPSISFMGGGQLWMFSIGVGHYIYNHYDISRIKFLASSCGCFAAVPLACGLDPYDWCRRDWSKCIDHFKSRTLGCLFDSKHFYYDLWDDYLPADAHITCTDRLFVSVTLFPSMKNRVISKFATRAELIWTITASMCLPFLFIRDFPVMLGVDGPACVDGGFSNDAPCLDSYTITVSALHHEADISPHMHRRRRRHQQRSQLSSTHDADKEGEEEITITALDIILVPEFSRVWQIGGMAERAAALCEDFERHEWTTIRKDTIATIDFSSESTAAALVADTINQENARTPPRATVKNNVLTSRSASTRKAQIGTPNSTNINTINENISSNMTPYFTRSRRAAASTPSFY